MEFDYAATAAKPILAFIHQVPEDIPSGKTDQNDALREKLSAFRRKVEAGHHVKYWKNPDDLKAQVIQSVSAETRRNPQEGWVRASRASDPFVAEQLRQQIDNLRAQLKAVRDTPPRGSEQYAGGDEVFEAEVQYVTRLAAGQRTREFKIIKVTWNEIFYKLGPMLLEEASERQIQSRLSEELWSYEKSFAGQRPDLIQLKDDSFETIKVQLLALGLIRRSERKHIPSDNNKYWSLTSFGETTMMKLRAIPKATSEKT
jgi:hypothetical protein